MKICLFFMGFETAWLLMAMLWAAAYRLMKMDQQEEEDTWFTDWNVYNEGEGPERRLRLPGEEDIDDD